MSKRFFILGLPRSRTAWLANLLTVGTSFCFHDGLLGCKSLADLYAKMDGVNLGTVGDSDTGLLHFMPHVRHDNMDAKIVLIERPLIYSLVSSGKAGLPVEGLPAMQQKLEAAKPYCDRVIPYSDLEDEKVVRGLFTWLTGFTWSHRRWLLLKDLTVQVDMPKFCAKVLQESNSTEALMASVRGEEQAAG